MKNRLESLRAQRALIAQHLSWIDNEIACCGETPPKPENPIIPIQQEPLIEQEKTEEAPDVTLTEFETEFEVRQQSIHNEVRNGIFLYTGIAAALLALLVVYVTFFYGE